MDENEKENAAEEVEDGDKKDDETKEELPLAIEKLPKVFGPLEQRGYAPDIEETEEETKDFIEENSEQKSEQKSEKNIEDKNVVKFDDVTDESAFDNGTFVDPEEAYKTTGGNNNDDDAVDLTAEESAQMVLSNAAHLMIDVNEGGGGHHDDGVGILVGNRSRVSKLGRSVFFNEEQNETKIFKDLTMDSEDGEESRKRPIWFSIDNDSFDDRKSAEEIRKSFEEITAGGTADGAVAVDETAAAKVDSVLDAVASAIDDAVGDVIGVTAVDSVLDAVADAVVDAVVDVAADAAFDVVVDAVDDVVVADADAVAEVVAAFDDVLDAVADAVVDTVVDAVAVAADDAAAPAEAAAEGEETAAAAEGGETAAEAAAADECEEAAAAAEGPPAPPPSPSEEELINYVAPLYEDTVDPQCCNMYYMYDDESVLLEDMKDVVNDLVPSSQLPPKDDEAPAGAFTGKNKRSAGNSASATTVDGQEPLKEDFLGWDPKAAEAAKLAAAAAGDGTGGEDDVAGVVMFDSDADISLRERRIIESEQKEQKEQRDAAAIAAGVLPAPLDVVPETEEEEKERLEKEKKTPKLDINQRLAHSPEQRTCELCFMIL